MYGKWKMALAGLAVLAALVWVPVLHAILLVFNLVMHLVVMTGQWLALRSRKRRKTPLNWQGTTQPFVTIQVLTHNEPPELVIETLRSLARLDWEAYEVQVVDNNTTDPAVWRPLEQACRELGPRFRFLHVEGLSGFKAGAMNWARQFIDPRAEFLFVVDADYVVEPWALRRAVAYGADPKVALVQFPQDYRNVCPENRGIVAEYRHFFSGYMAMADRLGCVPSTGTLTLVRVSALRALGGFSEDCVTEDAELGLRLMLAGHRAVFADERIGHGLMPHDLRTLKRQRWRWAFGNAQILRTCWRQLLFKPGPNWRQRVGCFVHLTAWFNFNLIPSLSLIVLAALAQLGVMTAVQPYLVVIAAFTLLSYFILRSATLSVALRRDGLPVSEIARACVVHAGLGWIFSTSWLKCLWSPDEPFGRTDKFIGAHIPVGLRAVGVELLIGIALLASAGILIAADFFLGPIAAVLMAAARFSVLWVAREMKATFGATEKAWALMTRKPKAVRPTPAPVEVEDLELVKPA